MITQQGCPDNNSQPPNGYEPDPWEFCCECGEAIVDDQRWDWATEAQIAFQFGHDCVCGDCQVKKNPRIVAFLERKWEEQWPTCS